MVVTSLASSPPPAQVFIVGMNGSGTTMLLDHLASHSWIFGYPAETKSLPYFITHEAKYGDLNVDENFLLLWRDMKKSVIGRAGILRQEIPPPDIRGRTAAGAFNHIMQHLAKAQDKPVWCEKTPMHVHHLSLLAKAFPDAKFVHVIRDGRDCAASFHRRWRFNPVRTVFRWKRAVRAGRQQGSSLGPRYHEVRYEEITEAPEPVFRRLCSFLDVPFEATVLSSVRSRPDSAASSESEVTRNPRRAVDYFEPAEVRQMESVAGRLLAELGYPCENQYGDRGPGRWQLGWWQITDDLRRFGAVALRRGRVFRPSKWRYIASRIRSALKQKATM
jgi:hypothetical protein